MDEAKAVAAGYGERAPVNRGIPTQSARSGEIPKIQTPLFGNMPPSALSGIVVQTFPSVRKRKCDSEHHYFYLFFSSHPLRWQ
ncbi:hypothetical protein C9397_00010 [Xanthomonas vasicola pv. vasculorum]|uniref:Uncharacterized protein n=4 Tax=Xanthomonas vasicola TaxID=56459 RepID=A0AAE8FBQ2_XANVA|nr:hypothetical protein C7V42_00385 [Xanthomonas vasicola pv. vasculorum]TWQ07527.1 hypothetical protein FQK02_00375 [Xanthomonas vasicola]AZM69544.1 hypothetical protein CXP37_00385 [Xanthomonas vasicola pv. vasculorum]OWF57382.1 hypothetical protein B1H41_21360 [Xanthomonas vasicola pv. vasculorum]PUE67946.1 hypothetical protein C7Y63_21690 [Xanthomonas vasicola pv. vasculorum]